MSGAYPIQMIVNGRHTAGTAEGRTLLVHYLRETLRLTGTHVGCDTSQCGACSVILNGRVVKSCNVLAVQADGATIETIEGIADGEDLHPVQQGLYERHGLQCGFCTPGMVITAVDLLRRIRHPTEEDIKRSLEGVLCRCTGYVGIVEGIEWAVEHTLPPADE
jgi:aerobic carbon-monoxide dehydrogenase small subunit